MPANTYYQPYPPQYYPYQASPQQPQGTTANTYQLQSQQQQPVLQANSILTVFLDTEDEAARYPVGAGVTAIIFVFKAGKFFIKETGTNGVPKPIRTCNFQEETSSPIPPHQNDDNFVRQSDLDEIRAKLNSLIEKLGGDD